MCIFSFSFLSPGVVLKKSSNSITLGTLQMLCSSGGFQRLRLWVSPSPPPHTHTHTTWEILFEWLSYQEWRMINNDYDVVSVGSVRSPNWHHQRTADLDAHAHNNKDDILERDLWPVSLSIWYEPWVLLPVGPLIIKSLPNDLWAAACFSQCTHGSTEHYEWITLFLRTLSGVSLGHILEHLLSRIFYSTGNNDVLGRKWIWNIKVNEYQMSCLYL